MTEAHLYPELIPWKPTPAEVPYAWLQLVEEFAQKARGSPHEYILKVKYDAQGTGDLLRTWGVPWQVVVAGYLWEYDKQEIKRAGLSDADRVISHINESTLYASYIEDENLPPLLTPPYKDLGGLLLVIAIYYQALKALQRQSEGKTLPGKALLSIESIGRTLRNIATKLGMWRVKREVEDLTEQLRNPLQFLEAQQEHKHLLEQDMLLLEEISQLLSTAYQEATGQKIYVGYIPCGIAGKKRRLQDAHTTVTLPKTELTGFDLVTFDVIVSTVKDCYAALGILSQLGTIQDRVTDQIANPKPNGCSWLAFGLVLKAQTQYLKKLRWAEDITRTCQLQIATPFLQAITWYGCLYPACYDLYMWNTARKVIDEIPWEDLWQGQEGKVILTIQKDIDSNQGNPSLESPIVVYNKNHRPVALSKGATALDFAFALDSNVAKHAVEVLINNRKAPLRRVLDAGDVVEIITSTEAQTFHQPFRNYATTSTARYQMQEASYQNRRGYELLNEELGRYYYTSAPQELDQALDEVVRQYKLGTRQSYLQRLAREGKPPYTPSWAAETIMRHIREHNERLLATKSSSWVALVDEELLTNKHLFHKQSFCQFCNPVYPQDTKIMGHLRQRQKELIIHKESCPHLLEKSRHQHSILLPMSWQLQPSTFPVAFSVLVEDRKRLIHDITRQLHRHQCELITLHAEPINMLSGIGHIYFTIETHSDKEALGIWEALYKIDNVIKVDIDSAHTPLQVQERLEQQRKQGITIPVDTVIDPPWEEKVGVLPLRPRTLMNPFNISRPATAKMFFGRSAEIATMRRELCDGQQGRALILYGPRRSGKTSICKNFLERQVQPPYWHVLFSLQNYAQHTEDQILEHLAEQVRGQFREQLHQQVPGWEDYPESDPQIRLKRILQCCIAQIPGTRLVLALDEFGGVLEAHERGFLESRFFTYWKELLTDIPQVSLILSLPTSSHYQLTSTKFVNAFSFADTLPMQFLDTESAKQLLVDPLREQSIEIQPQTVALATKLTGGNPYYLNLIGGQLIRYLNHQVDQQIVTDRHLNLAVDQIIVENNASQNFDFLLKELQNRAEYAILNAIVELTRHTRQPQAQLKTIAENLDLPVSSIRRHLDRLRTGLILEENGSTDNLFYSFKIEIVRRWLVHNHWLLAGEIDEEYRHRGSTATT